MFCHTCSRGSNSRLPFYCPTCARNHLYSLRYEHAQLLLQKEVYGQQIYNTVTGRVADNKEPTSSRIPKSVEQYEDKPSRFTIQAIKSRGLQSASRTQEILKHVQVLKEEIQMGKDEITRRRSVLSQRRSDARSVNYRLVERRTAESNTVQEDIKERQDYWDVAHKKIAASRVLLCREAASLYRLRQKSRRKDGQITSVVTIGGLPIIDLRDMNCMWTLAFATLFPFLFRSFILTLLVISCQRITSFDDFFAYLSSSHPCFSLPFSSSTRRDHSCASKLSAVHHIFTFGVLCTPRQSVPRTIADSVSYYKPNNLSNEVYNPTTAPSPFR